MTGRRSNQLNYAPGAGDSVAALDRLRASLPVTRVDLDGARASSRWRRSSGCGGGSSGARSRPPGSSSARCSARASRRTCSPAGTTSPYTPLVALAGAAVGALLLETVGTMVGNARGARCRSPPLRALDSAGGLAFGAATGLVLVWVAGAVALHLPGQTELRRERAAARRCCQRLNDVVPPARLMEAIAARRPVPGDRRPARAGRRRPTRGCCGGPACAQAAPSVVRVLGDACGLAVSGSGWVARRELVVTAAHVVAGQERARRSSSPGGDAASTPSRWRSTAQRRRRAARPRRCARGRCASPSRSRAQAVAILGYPESGPFAATAGRIGRTTTVLSDDAYGEGPVARTVTSLARPRAARQLGRAGGERARRGRDDRVRRARGLRRRLRRAARRRAHALDGSRGRVAPARAHPARGVGSSS